MSEPLSHRYDFVLLFDVQDGNPNGDPDAGNLPRIDPETGEGLVTDVCLKRKVRNYVGLRFGEEPPYDIYFKEGIALNQLHEKAYRSTGVTAVAKKLPKREADARRITQFMCDNFYDVRTFGAVMSTEVNAGQVRGPVQLTFGRSCGPVTSLEHTITRASVTNERDLAKGRTMGRKHTIPYGLYRTYGFISAPLARQTGFSDKDLDLLWEALLQMFEHDRAAARGFMSTRGLYAFRHKNALGCAPAHQLLERVRISRDDADRPARGFSDFSISVDEKNLPDGISMLRLAD